MSWPSSMIRKGVLGAGRSVAAAMALRDRLPVEGKGLTVQDRTGVFQGGLEHRPEPADPGVSVHRPVHQLPARLQQQPVVDEEDIVLGPARPRGAGAVMPTRPQQGDHGLAGAGAADDEVTPLLGEQPDPFLVLAQVLDVGQGPAALGHEAPQPPPATKASRGRTSPWRSPRTKVRSSRTLPNWQLGSGTRAQAWQAERLS